MTTETDELLKRISDDGEGFVNKEGVPPDAFGDPGGEYPKANYQNQQTVNRACLLYTSPSPRDVRSSRMPSSA